MKKLVQEKQAAIRLRKKGLSYKEILARVPVAKSTLSLWLKDLPLTSREKQLLRTRKDANISRGRIKAAAELRARRLEREQVYLAEAKAIFNEHKNDPLFHAGIVMYWAEGAKTSSYWMIVNTDHDVIIMMIDWLKKYPRVSDNRIFFRLYIHKPYADNSCEKWWQSKLGVSSDKFLKTVIKPTAHISKQKPAHKGCLRIEVRNSKGLFLMMKVLKGLAVDYYRKQ
tara:strand:- start:19 stop:696 length:678 start_codon:yes stop_codon:yes gene_type:complete